MKFPSIKIEGSILSAQILSDLSDEKITVGQNASDFGLEKGQRVSEHIQSAWALATQQWQVFKARRDMLGAAETGTTQVRKFWLEPLLDVLGYQCELQHRGEEVQGKSYLISHREPTMAHFPIHLVGFQDQAQQAPEKRSTLDIKPSSGTSRMSPHALVQEYLNLTEHLYAIVSNGLQLRLLRDSTRLVKLSYLEFNLEQMMEEGLFADFRLLYRLLHRSRMPKVMDQSAESLIESYHQQALEDGEAIRDKLGEAVKDSIVQLANGFIAHPANNELREALNQEQLNAKEYYQLLLRLIYRTLFLMVTEERDLLYDKSATPKGRRIYYEFYSIDRLRKLAESSIHVDPRFDDYWEGLKNTFQLFEKEHFAHKVGLKPLAGGLFGSSALGELVNTRLDNQTLLQSLRRLGVFEHPVSHSLTRVNYASLNVEELGSVYEGLLELEAVLKPNSQGKWEFGFTQGSERSTTGSHYTPDELVLPLIRHSLDYQIENRLSKPAQFVTASGSQTLPEKELQEKALLGLRVADIACGSGHILLAAARRIGTALAKVRTNEEQPSPEAQRHATRDVIRNCIYGVDKNPMAVELCKVALWIEAHEPGAPLNFLDHHIQCGDAIVGLKKVDELFEGIPNTAFKKMTGDDTGVRSDLAKRNKKERKSRSQLSLALQQTQSKVGNLADRLRHITAMPEGNPAEVQAKEEAFKSFIHSKEAFRFEQMANACIANYWIPKSEDNERHILTDGRYQNWLRGVESPSPETLAIINTEAQQQAFFHWFTAFPDVMQQGGFDCILGNPPFLGDKKLRKAFGDAYINYLPSAYQPAGLVDLVAYFFRRAFTLLKKSGFQSLISTNTIAQGNTREGGLEVILSEGGSINHAIRSMRWPGKAAVEVALVTIYKGDWLRPHTLNSKKVKIITSYLDDSEALGNPCPLKANEGKSFVGSYVLGKGFVLEPEEAQALIKKHPKNKDVLYPYLNGQDLNSRPDQSPSRWVINFFDWPLRRYSEQEWDNLDPTTYLDTEDRIEEGRTVPIAPPYYELPVAYDYPDCIAIIERDVKNERLAKKGDRGAEYWWQFLRIRGELYQTIAPLERVLVVARISKTVAFTFMPINMVFADAIVVHALNDYSEFGLMQSTIMNVWAWNYCTTMKTDLNYTPTNTVERFPIPKNENSICELAESYYHFRKLLCLKNNIGLTKHYSIFHDFNEDSSDYLKAREQHRQLDLAVIKAYGWDDLINKTYPPADDAFGNTTLHGFYEVDYLPENDRVRFTFHPEARKEILKRLLLLNHERRKEEELAGLWKGKEELIPRTKKRGGSSKKASIKPKPKQNNPKQGGLF